MKAPANDNQDDIRFLSVCSGIEAASVAWNPLGWKCVGVAEIEPFPAFVLNHHYGAGRPRFMPDPMEVGIKPKDAKARQTAIRAMSTLPVDAPLTNWGDFTKIDVSALGRVDILCGGTPCQAFSIAGLRNSLDDARGNLTLSFVRLAHELADRNGLRNAVWENVPGVLSTKDNAFGCFLGALVGADDALPPPAGRRWPDSGMVSGPKGRAAWTIKDAQFFGLAQRRKRVIVVADFGTGADPAAVLFEFVGVQGNSPPSREAGKDIAPTISARPTGGGGLGTDFDLDGGLDESAVPLKGAVAYGGNRTSGPIDIAAAFNSHGGPAGRLDFESETFIHQTVATIDASYGRRQGASGQDANHGHSHLVPHAIQAGALRTNPNSGPDGVGVQEGVAYTLEARAEVQAVAYSIMPQNSGKDYKARVVDVAQPLMAGGPVGGNQGGDFILEPVCVTGQVTHTLKAEGADASEGGTGRGTPIICVHGTQDPCVSADAAFALGRNGGQENVIAFSAKDYGADASVELSPTLRAGGFTGSHANGGVMPAIAMTVAIRGREGGATAELGGEVATALAGPQGGGDKPHVLTSAVRRLTPTECERLQGFPDGYTDIPWRKKPTSPDGPRYKSLGNSWAVPKFRWLGERIQGFMPTTTSEAA